MSPSSKLRTVVMTAAIAVPLAAPLAILTATTAHAGIFISVGIAPPPLPVYVQPALPGEGYIWTPGYWAWADPGGYYWVPGVWVRPPQVGFLWTPAYWGWEGGRYRFYDGYWGPHVGFYGGINYGFGYGGVGFEGGYWRGGGFFYNHAVNNFGGVHVTNVYEHNVVVNNNTYNRVSFNGGNGGVPYRANAQEQAALHENHVAPTGEQFQHQNFAAQNPQQRFNENHGNPSVRAAATPAAFRANPNQREANQDQRIANGLRSGQMTSGEAARADQRQANIDRQVHNDRAANGGTLTQQERQQVNREQNGASRQIYNDNHNGNTIAPNAVDNREANQQQRTANGLRNGQVTSGEAARADQRQANVDQQVHNDRVGNGGGLNQQQRQQINRQQNADSRQIYNQNHNANAMPRAQGGLPHEAAGSGAYRAPSPAPAARPAPAPRQEGGHEGGGGREGGGHEGGKHGR